MDFIKSAGTALILAILYLYFFRDSNKFSKQRIILSDNINDEYDYVIVGGGSAGSVLASRLSEDRSKSVLLLEAGGFYDENSNIHSPLHWPILQRTEIDWSYFTEPQAHSCIGLKYHQGYWPRGRVLGGSGAINAMNYIRGSRFDYDEWERRGCSGWSYKEVLPYFLKSEDIQIEELKLSRYHNTGGPMAVSGGSVTPIADIYLEAGKELGYNITDNNAETQEGFSKAQLNVRKGVRDSSAVAFLGSFEKRQNLDIVINTFVTKVDIKNKKATGVYYIRNGKKEFVKAKLEVLLSAGAINSPQLLMLSGIGPKEHLQDHNIPVHADLPVGENLQDHLSIYLFSKINESISLSPQVLSSLKTHLQYKLFGTGPLSMGWTDGSAFFTTDEKKLGLSYPDIQTLFVSALIPISNNNFKDAIKDEYELAKYSTEGFTTVLIATHPRSRGTIRLNTTDPFDHPLIDPQYFVDKSDVKDFIAGIRIWEKFLETETMKKLGINIEDMKMSFCAHHEFRTDEYWECMVRHLAITMYHPCCTCKMGSDVDKTTVLDSKLRVKGINGLRVVDASVFPQTIAGNTNAPTIMVAEKAADIIRGIDSVKRLRDNLPDRI
ncbi:glucose dehydrogenase [FAD, quinone]-like [Ruditapes philippinarum]|uniref:glucose dehydrogenase [FAD, quinone]-like n=1 Tax=Ruditapes philippinarum TaxID=129788 RepID=UPI00295BCC52|nr:glucose dehydrogenase [FAD, quinone]-like [Ruditapes philippinarum]